MKTSSPLGEAATEVRRKQILAFINARDFVRVADVSATFGVSEVTVRADLDTLAERGQIRRVRGGAMSRLLPPTERPFAEEQTARREQKDAIGRAAAALVTSGETIILDVGTTTAAIAKALLDHSDLRDVTIFTNALNIALDLEVAVPRFTVVVMGGTVRAMGHSLIDPLGEMTLEHISAHTVFLACNGVDIKAGITNTSLAEVSTKRRLLRAARRRVVVADSSKIGVAALAHLCDIDEIDLLVTDDCINPLLLAGLRERALDVQIAECAPALPHRHT